MNMLIRVPGKKASLLSDEVYQIIKDNAEELDSTIIYNRDFGYDYFGFKTLERSYLLKLNGKIAGKATAHAYAGFRRDSLERSGGG